MGYLPSQNARQRQERSRRRGTYALVQAVVVDVPGDGGHGIVVRPVTDVGDEKKLGKPRIVDVITPSTGEISLPRKGDMVLMGSVRGKERPVAIGAVYAAQDDITSYDSGDRVIGADSAVRLEGDLATVPSRTDDPEDAPEPSIWYREDLGEYRAVEDGNVVTFDTTTV